MWTHRIMLESLLHTDNSFITLTYEDKKLPRVSTNSLPTLDPKHLQNWLKRLRKEIVPLRIRYYACGEYGDETQRPHYHVALFGYPGCSRGRTLRRVESSSRPVWEQCCASCRMVGKTWGLGDIDIGTLALDSAQYVCGYVTKKMTAKDDTRLYGRYPEFARMSNRPGLGFGALQPVADQWNSLNLASSEADVPAALRHGGRMLPLGRYLRRELRALVGMEKEAPEATLQEASERLLGLRRTVPTREGGILAQLGHTKTYTHTLKEDILNANKQKNLNTETRNNIHKKVRSL